MSGDLVLDRIEESREFNKTLADFGITLNINPPEHPPKHFIILKDNIDHREAVYLAMEKAKALRDAGVMDPVHIWIRSDTLRAVVQEVTG